jgi:hypothetical protein
VTHRASLDFQVVAECTSCRREKKGDGQGVRRHCGPSSKPGASSTDKGAGRRVFGGTLVACLRPSGPPLRSPHRKTRASDGSRVFAALRPDPPIVNHSNSRRASFLKFDPRCCLYPGRHSCADGLARGGSLDRVDTRLFPSPSFSPSSFPFAFAGCRTRAHALISTSPQAFGRHKYLGVLPYLLHTHGFATAPAAATTRNPDHERPPLSPSDSSHPRLIK